MRSLGSRKLVVAGIFVLTALIFIIRLLVIQVFTDKYKVFAESNSIRKETIYPARGVIFDRNGELLVTNEAAYDLMVLPMHTTEMDTAAFCELMDIDLPAFRKKMDKASDGLWYRKASVFIKEISARQFGRIQEELFKYHGFFVQTRTLRYYPNACSPHMLGYIGEVSPRFLELDTTGYYHSGDYIGLSGIEKSYEKELRGTRGVRKVMVDVFNKVKGPYMGGQQDTAAVSGFDLVSTISVDLQKYGEQLMKNKKGSIVAIEPKTGEVLTMVSAPSYDPNLLVGRQRAKNYLELQRNDSLNPLFSRALQAKYPPGSIFKLVQALIGLQEEVISPNTGFACNKSLVDCHNHPSAVSVVKAVQFSCNPYFYRVFQRLLDRNLSPNQYIDCAMSLDKWKQQVLTFGLGRNIGLDLPNVKAGSIPGSDFYNRIYGEKAWLFQTIYSLSIGQGEIEVVPVQMANLAAIIANNGYYVTPHVIKAKGKQGNYEQLKFDINYTSVDKSYFPLIKEGMRMVVNEPGGTARRARIDSITVCGKTGTAQNPHGEDHSVFIAFAPMENPQIAIAVYVENSGFGGTWAAPIASLMIEKYLTGKIEKEQKEKRILEADFIHAKK